MQKEVKVRVNSYLHHVGWNKKEMVPQKIEYVTQQGKEEKNSMEFLTNLNN